MNVNMNMSMNRNMNMNINMNINLNVNVNVNINTDMNMNTNMDMGRDTDIVHVPESMFQLNDFAIRIPADFRKSLVHCELGFRKLLHKATGRFQLASMTVEILSASSKGLSHS
jgi:hypothetical protein